MGMERMLSGGFKRTNGKLGETTDSIIFIYVVGLDARPEFIGQFWPTMPKDVSQIF
jgi:hypothetical protein